MAAEQISELITLAKTESKPDPVVETNPQPKETLEPPISPLSQAVEPDINDDRVAAHILSAPPQEENDLPVGTSNVLKTRKQLIQKIKEVCEHRGTDAKSLNLARRRKNSLQEILKTQFAEAAEQAVPEHDVHGDLQGILPEGMEAREKFALDMAYRLDLTLCKVLEKGVEWSDGYHGLTAHGFASGIEENETLSNEIRNCWQEILNEEDNQWLLEYCSATSRLVLCHVYGLLNSLRKKEGTPKNDKPRPVPKFNRLPSVPIRKEAVPTVETQPSSGKLRHLAMLRQKSRQNHAPPVPVPAGAGGLVKSI